MSAIIYDTDINSKYLISDNILGKGGYSFVFSAIDNSNKKRVAIKIKLTKSIPCSQIRTWIYQLLNAIDYYHNNGVVHKDIKLANILVDAKNDIKLCDFCSMDSYELNQTN